MSKTGLFSKRTWERVFSGKVKDILLLGGLAIVLFFTAWRIFRTDENTQAVAIPQSETEMKVARILQEIVGVGEASVVVCQTEDEVQSVVVVCEGARDFQVVMNIREAVAAALNTQQKAVKIYLKKS